MDTALQLQDTSQAPIVDGFVYSASLMYLPTSYRASALAQMDLLRRATGYRTRWYLVPVDEFEPVPAFSNLEYQVGVQYGSYFWGLSLSAPFNEVEEEAGSVPYIHVQITDACTETPLFSDYVRGPQIAPTGLHPQGQRWPVLLTPRLVGKPGLLNVEVYNRASVDIRCQVALFVAEPSVPPETLTNALIDAGLIEA